MTNPFDLAAAKIQSIMIEVAKLQNITAQYHELMVHWRDVYDSNMHSANFGDAYYYSWHMTEAHAAREQFISAALMHKLLSEQVRHVLFTRIG